MKYVNKVTGSKIETRCEISGDDWEKVEDVKNASSTKRRKKVSDKNEHIRND